MDQEFAVRGAGPGACINKEFNFPCSELSQHCVGKSGPDCDVACNGCSGSATNSNCSNGMPWNSICDPAQATPVAGGCGKYYIAAVCVYEDGRCHCKGVAGATDCTQFLQLIGPCIEPPPGGP